MAGTAAAADCLLHCTIPSPVGPMTAVVSDASLLALEFGLDDRHARLDARLARWRGSAVIRPGRNDVIEATERWLADYFAGQSADVSALPISMSGSPFERSVWQRLLAIPAGETRSYGEIAAELGIRNGSRAVGLANGANPLAIIVPCHRVIGGDGSLTGYGGGLERKRWLLEHERRWGSARPLPF